LTHVLVQKVLPIHSEAQFAPSGVIFQVPQPPNLPPIPDIDILAIEQWFTINGQPVLTSGDLVKWGIADPAASGVGPIIGLSHWTVNGKPMATFGIATAPPLGLSISESQLVPYFSA
jgi:uncharacterized Zn-binding protein involved in type VI secretion